MIPTAQYFLAVVETTNWNTLSFFHWPQWFLPTCSCAKDQRTKINLLVMKIGYFQFKRIIINPQSSDKPMDLRIAWTINEAAPQLLESPVPREALYRLYLYTKFWFLRKEQVILVYIYIIYINDYKCLFAYLYSSTDIQNMVHVDTCSSYRDQCVRHFVSILNRVVMVPWCSMWQVIGMTSTSQHSAWDGRRTPTLSGWEAR